MSLRFCLKAIWKKSRPWPEREQPKRTLKLRRAKKEVRRMASKEKMAAFGLPQNTAGALAYVLGWLTGLVFVLVEKDNRYVRFHAMQSVMFFAVLTIASFVP